jgi:hypothetical protein
MSVSISRGQTFGQLEQITNTKLHNLVDLATIAGLTGTNGTFTANGATPVTVANTSVEITDTIIISLNTVGGTVGVQPHVATITAGTGFTVLCTASDTSIYNYVVYKRY